MLLGENKILDCVTDYYQTLRNSNNACGNSDLFDLQAKQLDENEKIETNKPIPLGEIGIALSTSKNNKSLGID